MAQQENEFRRKGKQHFVQSKPPSHDLSQLITFFLSLTLMCTLLGIMAKNSFLSKNFTTKELISNENVAVLHKGISASINSFTTDTDAGFELSGDLISKQQIKEDLSETIDNLYAGKKELLAPSKIVGQVEDNFMKQANRQGISTQSENFLSYKSNFIAQVKAAMNNQINNSLLSKAAQMFKKSQNILQSMYLWGMILSTILAVLLLVQTRSVFRFSYYSGIAFLVIGLIVWLLTELVKVSGLVENFAASIGMYRSFIIDYGNAVTAVFTHYASVFSYVGLGLLLIALLGRFIRKIRL